MGESRSYRKFSAQQKTELVLASLRGPKTIAQLCREHDISESLLRKWREQFLAAGAERLSGRQERTEADELRRQVSRLERALGRKTMEVEIAMQWNSSYNESVHSFANTINTHEGGTHEEGFRASLTSVVNKYAKEKKLLKENDASLSGEDVREGLAAIISIRLREPQFEGQTKGKLGSTEAKSFVQKACNDWIADWFERQALAFDEGIPLAKLPVPEDPEEQEKG